MNKHCLRALFNPVVNESDLFNPDTIERQLAHVPKNRIRSAYKRAQFWDERVLVHDFFYNPNSSACFKKQLHAAKAKF